MKGKMRMKIGMIQRRLAWPLHQDFKARYTSQAMLGYNCASMDRKFYDQ
jgi:hypothetical protein